MNNKLLNWLFLKDLNELTFGWLNGMIVYSYS